MGVWRHCRQCSSPLGAHERSLNGLASPWNSPLHPPVCIENPCVSHTLQTLLDLDPRATVLSVDSVGAFNLTSRNAMMAGLAQLEEGDKLLPFVRLFQSSSPTFLWEDDVETTHHIRQGREGRCTKRSIDASPLRPWPAHLPRRRVRPRAGG